MEPDRGNAGEPNGGSLRRLGGKGFPGESLIGTLLSGLYAARARAGVCSVHRRRRQLLRRRVKFLRRLRVPTIGLSNIGAYQFSEC
jgi:hypothetical protein